MLKISSSGIINKMLESCNLQIYSKMTKKISMYQNKNIAWFLLYIFFKDIIKNIYWFYSLLFETRSHSIALAGLVLFARARIKGIYYHA